MMPAVRCQITMIQLATKRVLPVLAALAVLAVASSAQSAIQTDLSSISSSSSWSASQPTVGDCVTSESEPGHSILPTADALNPSKLNPSSVPGSMSGQNSTQTQPSAGVAILPTCIKQSACQSFGSTIAWSLPVIATWRGDTPLDPPKNS